MSFRIGRLAVPHGYPYPKYTLDPARPTLRTCLPLGPRSPFLPHPPGREDRGVDPVRQVLEPGTRWRYNTHRRQCHTEAVQRFVPVPPRDLRPLLHRDPELVPLRDQMLSGQLLEEGIPDGVREVDDLRALALYQTEPRVDDRLHLVGVDDTPHHVPLSRLERVRRRHQLACLSPALADRSVDPTR